MPRTIDTTAEAQAMAKIADILRPFDDSARARIREVVSFWCEEWLSIEQEEFNT